MANDENMTDYQRGAREVLRLLAERDASNAWAFYGAAEHAEIEEVRVVLKDFADAAQDCASIWAEAELAWPANPGDPLPAGVAQMQEGLRLNRMFLGGLGVIDDPS